MIIKSISTSKQFFLSNAYSKSILRLIAIIDKHKLLIILLLLLLGVAIEKKPFGYKNMADDRSGYKIDNDIDKSSKTNISNILAVNFSSIRKH